jgi:phosphatidylinositol alpha-mannosyltransferase
MKIGLVLDDTLDNPDGVQQHVLTVGAWLTKNGHEVHYLVANTSRKDIKNIHSLGRFLHVSYNQNNVRTPLPASRRKIRRLLKEQDFDVLHVQLPYSPFLAKQIITACADRTAVIGTFHILPASRMHAYSNKLLRLMLGSSIKRFDKIFAVSEPAVHFARQAYGINAEYLPNPIDEGVFRQGRRLAAYTKKKLTIVFLGRLVKRKGVIELVKAYNMLNEQDAQATRLVICGKGPLRTRAKSLVLEGRNVEFVGYVSEKDKPHYLASADIAVFPSTGGESFGIVLIEAMAAGARVVLGGNNPGYKSILGPQPYLLFNPKDLRSFADHLSLFINDQQLRDRMFTWQIDTVGQYDIEVIGPKLLGSYEQALRTRTP